MIEEAKKIIYDSDVIIISAGAGISADSVGLDGGNLPTFRGDAGFLKAYPLLGDKKMSFAQVATQDALNKDPRLAWSLYGHMFDLFNETIPHTGFQSLLAIAEKKEDYFVITSNIDYHFQKAGFDENKIYEIHGRITKCQCTECGILWTMTEDTKFDIGSNMLYLDEIPICDECGGLARPNIMMFNDYGFDNEETEIQAARFNKFMSKYDKGEHKIAIIELGCGVSVPTIRMMGEYIQRKVEGALLIRINPLDIDSPEGTVTIKVGGEH